MIYDQARARWRNWKFSAEHPDEKEYRHSLKEEAESLMLMANEIEEQVNDKEIDSIDPTLQILLKLKKEGLIEAYVLISAPDEGIAKDYPAYRSAHRDLIHQYLAEYIAAPLVQ